MPTTLHKPPPGRRLQHGHALARGLRHAWLLPERAGAVTRCAITGLSVPIGPTSGVWVSGGDGPAYDANGATGGAGTSTSPVAFDIANFSVVIVSQATAGNNGSGRWVLRLGSATNVLAVRLGWSSTNGTLLAAVQGVSGLSGSATGTLTWTVAVLSCDAINSRRLYANGRLIASATTTATADAALDRIGLANDNTAAIFHQTSAAFLYNRPLSEAEAQALSADPYVMFRAPAAQRRYLSAGAAFKAWYRAQGGALGGGVL